MDATNPKSQVIDKKMQDEFDVKYADCTLNIDWYGKVLYSLKALGLLFYICQLYYVLSGRYRKVGRATKLALMLYLTHFIVRQAIFSVFQFIDLSVETRDWMRPMSDYLVSIHICIFQWMMFRLKKIEIYMNPRYTSVKQVKKELGKFRCFAGM